MKIFGQVLDSDNKPMALANISIETEDKTNKLSEQADLDGNFVFENELITPDSEVEVTFYGYLPQKFKASQIQGKKIKLLLDVEVVDESLIDSVLDGKPKNNKNKEISSKKGMFVEHLQKHRFIYGGLGMLAGVFLIVRAFKNKK